MNDNIKISFIPQKPLARGETVLRGRPKFGLSFIISITILTLTLLGAVGQAVYINYQGKKNDEMRKILSDYNSKLEGNNILSQIDSLRLLEQKMVNVRGLLGKHRATSEIFSFLERTTPDIISFNDYSFKAESDSVVSVILKGRASGYDAIAYLSKVYDSEKSLIMDYTFSSFSLDDKGGVVFNVLLNIDPDALLYSERLNNDKLRKEKPNKDASKSVIAPYASSETDISDSPDKIIN